MKDNERTSIGIDKATLKIFQDFSKNMGVDLKSYMSLVAKYLERTGQDVTKDMNTAQEVSKLKDQQIRFLKTFEKEKLGPVANNLEMAVVELRNFNQTVKGIRADQKKDHEDLDTLIRFNIQQVKSVMEFISTKTEEAELKRVINFTESYRHSVLGFYRRLRGNILQRIADIPEAIQTCQQGFEIYDKVFDDLFEQADYYEKQKH